MADYTKRITFLEESWVVEALKQEAEKARLAGLNIGVSGVIRRLIRKALREQGYGETRPGSLDSE